MTSPTSNGLLSRFLSTIERFAYRYSILVIAASLILAILSLWVTAQKLTFKTGRGDLVAKGLPYVKLYKNYRAQFEDLSGMVVVVEGEKPCGHVRFCRSAGKKTASPTSSVL